MINRNRVRSEETWRLRSQYCDSFAIGEHRIKVTQAGKIDDMLDAVKFYDMEVGPTEMYLLNAEEFCDKFEKIY
jgi:hypothetical protein